MEYLSSLQESGIAAPTAVAVGKFDGIHRGHECLMERLLDKRREGLMPAVVTFDSSPRLKLNSNDSIQNLVTNEERQWILEQEGIELLVELPFNQEIMHMSPRTFVRLLTERLHMNYMVAGRDFRFGYQGKGDVKLLAVLAEEFRFDLEVVEKLRENRRDISSTYIREEILLGNVAAAGELLGYEYFLWGEVVHGNHLGQKLGMPTINFVPSPEKLLPRFGVYVTRVVIGHNIYPGVTNVGYKPTVSGELRAGVETHILHFRGTLYHERVKIVFLDFLRPERKFDSLDSLREQMGRDTKRAEEYFARGG